MRKAGSEEREGAASACAALSSSRRVSKARVAFLIALALSSFLGLTPAAGSGNAPLPEIPARAFLLLEAQTGAELAAQHADWRLPPASLTKLMTAYLLFTDLRAGRLRLDEPVTVSREAARLPGARMFLTAGEIVTVENLLTGMLVPSGNDATRALIEHVSGDQAAFVARMNAEARRLALADTQFVNAGGLHHPEHYSTARDLARLSQALRRDFPEHRHRFAQKSFTWAGITQPNRNPLLRDPAVDGLKTGHTEAAGFNLVASSERNGMPLIAVVLGAASESDRARAGRRLLDYGFQNYETRVVQRAAVPLRQLPLWEGERDEVALGVSEDLRVTLPRGGFETLTYETQLPAGRLAPVTRGQPLGRLILRHGDRILGEHALVALDDVGEGHFLKRHADRLRRWWRGQGQAQAAP